MKIYFTPSLSAVFMIISGPTFPLFFSVILDVSMGAPEIF